VLLARGLAGMVDQTPREAGISPDGLTGLSREQVTGFAEPAAAVLWTGGQSTPTSSWANCSMAPPR
jgi:hypothetical protein